MGKRMSLHRYMFFVQDTVIAWSDHFSYVNVFPPDELVCLAYSATYYRKLTYVLFYKDYYRIFLNQNMHIKK